MSRDANSDRYLSIEKSKEIIRKNRIFSKEIIFYKI